MTSPILSAAVDQRVEELKAAIDSEDVTRAVSVIRGRGAACVKIHIAASYQITRKLNSDGCVI